MSRIRSVHPGFFKDERLVPCSPFARLLFIGLGVEADDKGIFEWKPVTLKMSIFPGDNVDVAALLAELVEADSIRRFEVAGRAYGAIRNFRKFQKPKTPNSVHPMPNDIAEYVAFPRNGEMHADEPEPIPPKGENARQMEDGGGKPPKPPRGGRRQMTGAGVFFQKADEEIEDDDGAQGSEASARSDRDHAGGVPVLALVHHGGDG
jgi:hypothetical protein